MIDVCRDERPQLFESVNRFIWKMCAHKKTHVFRTQIAAIVVFNYVPVIYAVAIGCFYTCVNTDYVPLYPCPCPPLCQCFHYAMQIVQQTWDERMISIELYCRSVTHSNHIRNRLQPPDRMTFAWPMAHEPWPYQIFCSIWLIEYINDNQRETSGILFVNC